MEMVKDEMTERGLVVARKVAARYKARCWWADKDDLVQEATWAVLNAQQRFDPDKGSWEGYAWRAAMQWLRGVVWKASAPVSASFHKLTELEGLVRAPVDDALHKVSPELPPDEAYENEAWRADVRGELRILVEDFAGPLRGAVLSVMLDEREHDDAAREFGLETKAVRRGVRHATERARESNKLRGHLALVA